MTGEARRTAPAPGAAVRVRSHALAAAAPAAVFAALIAATLRVVWSDAGWPQNHEAGLFGPRTFIYAQHLARLDVLPVWTSADAAGFGSPMLLMYHKLFYYLAGSLTLVTGSIKAADAGAIAALLLAGAAGMYRLVRALGGRRFAAGVAGCCLLTANYTVLNWLVRGAMAEFSAAMLIPWALRSFVLTVRTGRIGTAFGIVMGLLWLAHSVLMFYAALILLVTYAILAWRGAASWSALNPARAWRPAAVLALFILPFVPAMAVLGPGYDFSRILTFPYQPMYQFRSPRSYFIDRGWHWGRTFEGFTTRLDTALVALVLVAVAGLVWRSRWRRRAAAGDPGAPPLGPIVVAGGVAALLQLPLSAPFYEWVPGAAFIQFPWRLLALITPALIAAAVSLTERVFPRAASRALLAGAGVWMVAACGAFAPIRYARIPLTPPPADVTFSSFREYEPRLAPPIADTRQQLARLWSDAGCAFAPLREPGGEPPAMEYRTTCAAGTVLPFPVYASALHAVRTSPGTARERCLAVPEARSLCAARVPAGRGTVSIDLPDMRALARWAIGMRTP